MADNILAGEVDHREGHEGGDFHSLKVADAPAVVGLAPRAPQYRRAPHMLLMRAMPGLAPGSSPGRTHPRQAVRPGAAQDDLAAAVLSCRPGRRRRYLLGRCST